MRVRRRAARAVTAWGMTDTYPLSSNQRGGRIATKEPETLRDALTKQQHGWTSQRGWQNVKPRRPSGVGRLSFGLSRRAIVNFFAKPAVAIGFGASTRWNSRQMHIEQLGEYLRVAGSFFDELE